MMQESKLTNFQQRQLKERLKGEFSSNDNASRLLAFVSCDGHHMYSLKYVKVIVKSIIHS